MSILKKLRVDVEKPLWLINAPGECLHFFEGAELKTRLTGQATIGQIVLFAEDSARLHTLAARILGRLTAGSLVWVAYPKKGSPLESDLHRDKVWEQLLAQLDGVASAAIDDTWTAMRFKLRDPQKKNSWIPMEERKAEGIDYINRTVTLPPDAVAAMEPYKGLVAFFYAMSFSHTREYVEAIVEAKKPETRQRRIEAMVKNVRALQEAKEARAALKKK
ncbi:MAG: YdeI/OmpD-associated family protein [Flavipsychrobacter sp.]|nr:YdeI/OmpD-associated family protein [Flavipsychrobacter sp.]